MKRIITGCLLLNFAMAAQAECNISSSIQNIDYGKRSAAMRQVDRGNAKPHRRCLQDSYGKRTLRVEKKS